MFDGKNNQRKYFISTLTYVYSKDISLLVVLLWEIEFPVIIQVNSKWVVSGPTPENH